MENKPTGPESFKDKVSGYFKGGSKLGKLRNFVIIALVIGLSFYTSLDNSSIDQNNAGLDSYNSGNYEDAVSQLENALDAAVTPDAKMNASLNLAYVYTSELQYDEALKYFEIALEHAAKNSYQYPLITGEIAMVEGDYAKAKENYLAAHTISPKEFQTLNALTLFYLNADDDSYYNPQEAVKYALESMDRTDQYTAETAKENLSVAYFANQQYQDALDTMNQMDLEVASYMYYWVALAQIELEDFEGAKQSFIKYQQAGYDLGPELSELISS